MDEVKLMQSVKAHEGLRLKPYKDSLGILTVGYGHNLESHTVTPHLAEEWLGEDLYSAIISAKMFPEWQFLDTDARQNAFAEMVFNIGPLGVSNFKNMLASIRVQDWQEVAKQALDSKWATQVGKRSLTLIAMLQTGNFPV